MSSDDRIYRNRVSSRDLATFNVCTQQSDLLVSTDQPFYQQALEAVYTYRGYIESYAKNHHDFLTSLSPVRSDDAAPPIIRDMIKAGITANVGPMAAVAGAISEYVAHDLLKISANVIVENGGDIFLKTIRDVKVGIFAGKSPLTFKINILLHNARMPIGVCTSSGTVGHSLSFGKADAVTVISKSSILADAAATAIGNLVKKKGDIRFALEKGMEIPGVLGVLIIVGDQIGVIGDVELI